MQREFKKVKDILSKSVYVDLLSKIENANSSLRTLVENSHRHGHRRNNGISKKLRLEYKEARKHAVNIYNAVVCGKHWKCPCKEWHCVHLRIESDLLEERTDQDSAASPPKFRMAFSTKARDPSKTLPWYWEEIETIPERINIPVKAPKAWACAGNTPQPASGTKKVQFVVSATLQSLPWSSMPTSPPVLPIPDFCSILCKVGPSASFKTYMGSIEDSDAKHRYCFYSMDKHQKSLETQTLEDLLSSSLQSVGGLQRPACLFSRHDRLLLAAILASNVLQLHGSWLKSDWRSRDIVFPKASDDGKAVVKQPYLAGHGVSTVSSPTITTTTSPLIANAVLFPLGLVLVELSLGQSISALRISDDDDTVEANANLKTGLRVLGRVYGDSGERYGNVVTNCFRWSATRNSTADDDDFQQLAFQDIVSPLIEDLWTFEGKGPIH